MVKMFCKSWFLTPSNLPLNFFRFYATRKVKPIPASFEFPTTEELLSSTEKIPETFESREAILFEEEKVRQLSLIPRLEKIEIEYKGLPKDETLIMNKHFSTPYNCAQHMTTSILERAPLAQFEGQLWDLHRPLNSDGLLQFLSFDDDEPHYVNNAFWRTCSFVLGCVLKEAIKEDYGIQLHSFPPPNIRTGSFVYDFSLNLNDWTPTESELRTLSSQMIKIGKQELPIHRLNVSSEFAQKLFENNAFKMKQIPDIASASSDGLLTVYKFGNFVEISKGPMVAHTGFMGRCSVTSVHKLPGDGMFRCQAVALPRSARLNHFAWEQIVKRAKKLNSSRLPS